MDYFIAHSHLSQSATLIFGTICCVYILVWISVSLHLAKLKIPVLLTSVLAQVLAIQKEHCMWQCLWTVHSQYARIPKVVFILLCEDLCWFFQSQHHFASILQTRYQRHCVMAGTWGHGHPWSWVRSDSGYGNVAVGLWVDCTTFLEGTCAPPNWWFQQSTALAICKGPQYR